MSMSMNWTKPVALSWTFFILLRPTEQWLDFVMANRMDKDFEHQHDIVIGPVAKRPRICGFCLV